MSLSDYIPSELEINRCIKSIAEGAHEAVLLAVHRPARISYRRVKAEDKMAASEAELLEHILSRNVASGSLVVPVTGASGVGKSHLIRIIDAKLRNSEETRHHLIIRIPKSASLREVVKLILAPLPESRYSGVKEAFRSALAEVDVDSAAIHILGHLEVALRRLAVSLREQAKALGATQSLKERLFHAEGLPSLLNDVVTSVHYRANVLPRIVRRAVSGSGNAHVLGTEGQFSPDDLRLPDSIDLGQAAKPVSTYYRAGLLAREGHGLLVAAEVLNSVVDEATQQLFRLQDSLGGMTLQEVILEIRRMLLAEKRELILLVEDFAALTGIQETLANVLIQEGIRDGIVEYATMRSVIAVTDGYLVGRDTLATRAAREWIVESDFGTEGEILALTRSIVAAYLNASRWGQDALIEQYTIAAANGVYRSDWLPVFRSDDDDDVVESLRAFGFESEIPLFPYNSSAIEYLARSAIRRGNALLFNPRAIIDEVLRAVLLPARDAFSKAAFPHAGIPAKEPSADVAQWIASFPGSDLLRARYRRTIVVWGNDPRSPSEVRDLPSPVYKTFGLPPPDTSTVTAPRSPPPSSKPGATRVSRGPDDAVIHAIEEQRMALERWSQDKVQLPQAIANSIREEVADLLNERIDSNAERFVRCTLKPTDISVPEAGGEGRVMDGSIKVANSNVDPNGSVRGDLLALLRLRGAKGRNDYAEYEDDLARSANLADRLRPKALAMLQSRNQRQLQQAILALRANGRILGLPEKGKTPKGIAALVTATVPTLEELPSDTRTSIAEWLRAQRESAAMRPRLVRLVVNTCGCFQGVGETPNGIDVARLVEEFPGDGAAFDYKNLEGLTVEESRQLAALTEPRVRARGKSMIDDVARVARAAQDELGSQFDKNALVASLKDLASTIVASGRWDAQSIGMPVSEFGRLCEEFRAAAIKESLDQIGAALVPDAESAENFVVRVGRVKIGPLLTTERFLAAGTRFVASATAEVSSMERQVEGIDPVAGASAVKAVFARLDKILAELAAGVHDVSA